MKNEWNKNTANKYINFFAKKNIKKDLALRIYSTHILGRNSDLVLHGGGNTSLKSKTKNIYDESIDVIYVKGSGWDMSNLSFEGMPGLKLKPLVKTLKLKKMNDTNMVNYLRNNLINSK